jgi:hypothetical protein
MFCFGNIYIPPENTKYSCLDAFNEIESEMFQLYVFGLPVQLLFLDNEAPALTIFL